MITILASIGLGYCAAKLEENVRDLIALRRTRPNISRALARDKKRKP